MAEFVLTKENFKETVLSSELPVLVDFWATWCGPCMMLAPVIEEIAKEYDGKIAVGKVNVDEQPELASLFGIQSIPTLMYFKNGELIDSVMGYRPKSAVLKFLEL